LAKERNRYKERHMIKVGVVGVGEMGQHHARLYSGLGCKLVGISDANPSRGNEVAGKFGVSYFPDYHDLLNKVDAVSIVVPTTAHHTVAMEFLNAGVHCLVEKPIAFDLDEARDMVKTAKAKKVHLAVGQIEQFNPAVKKLKQIIDEGTLGQILIISTRRVGPSSPRIRDVGIVIDSATHDIGVSNYLVGKKPTGVFSRIRNLSHEKEDHAIIVLDFDGTTSCIEVNWFTPHKVRTLVATGSAGIAYLDYIQQTIKVDNSHEDHDILIDKEEPLKIELRDFLDSIEEGRPPRVGGEEGLEILRIAIAASHSS
jgi:UDP-N-acetylglucosamine 3-dehydrogenase